MVRAVEAAVRTAGSPSRFRVSPFTPLRGAMSVRDATSTLSAAASSSLAGGNARELRAGDVRAGSLRRLATHPDVLLSVVLFGLALVPRLLYLLWAPVFIGGDSA